MEAVPVNARDGAKIAVLMVFLKAHGGGMECAKIELGTAASVGMAIDKNANMGRIATPKTKHAFWSSSSPFCIMHETSYDVRMTLRSLKYWHVPQIGVGV